MSVMEWARGKELVAGVKKGCDSAAVRFSRVMYSPEVHHEELFVSKRPGNTSGMMPRICHLSFKQSVYLFYRSIPRQKIRFITWRLKTKGETDHQPFMPDSCEFYSIYHRCNQSSSCCWKFRWCRRRNEGKSNVWLERDGGSLQTNG